MFWGESSFVGAGLISPRARFPLCLVPFAYIASTLFRKSLTKRYLSMCWESGFPPFCFHLFFLVGWGRCGRTWRKCGGKTLFVSDVSVRFTGWYGICGSSGGKMQEYIGNAREASRCKVVFGGRRSSCRAFCDAWRRRVEGFVFGEKSGLFVNRADWIWREKRKKLLILSGLCLLEWKVFRIFAHANSKS